MFSLRPPNFHLICAEDPDAFEALTTRIRGLGHASKLPTRILEAIKKMRAALSG